MTVSPAIPTNSSEATYRTKPHTTERILRDWVLKERLAFNLEPSKPSGVLQACLPESCKKQLGEWKPTDNVFRKMSSGFNNVSDVWIELMRFIGVWDFSPEQAILGTIGSFLDKENVRIKLNAVENNASRLNSIEVLCLSEPSYQGVIRYEGDRLSVPATIFEAVVERRLNVYKMSCDYLSEVLLIPDEDLTESAETLPMFLSAEFDETDDENEDSPELEATDARLEKMATEAETTPLGGAVNPKVHHMIPFDEREKNSAETERAFAERAKAYEALEDAQAERMAEIYSGNIDIDPETGEITDF